MEICQIRPRCLASSGTRNSGMAIIIASEIGINNIRKICSGFRCFFLISRSIHRRTAVSAPPASTISACPFLPSSGRHVQKTASTASVAAVHPQIPFFSRLSSSVSFPSKKRADPAFSMPPNQKAAPFLQPTRRIPIEPIITHSILLYSALSLRKVRNASGSCSRAMRARSTYRLDERQQNQRAPSLRAFRLPPAVREAGKRNAVGLARRSRD